MDEMNDQQKAEYLKLLKKDAELTERINEFYERRIKREKRIAEAEATYERLNIENSMKDKQLKQMMEEKEQQRQKRADEQQKRKAEEKKANEHEREVEQQKQNLESFLASCSRNKLMVTRAVSSSSTVSFAELQEHHQSATHARELEMAMMKEHYEWQLDEARRDIMMAQHIYLDTVADFRQLQMNMQCACLHHEITGENCQRPQQMDRGDRWPISSVLLCIILLISLCFYVLQHMLMLPFSFNLHYIRGPPPF